MRSFAARAIAGLAAVVALSASRPAGAAHTFDLASKMPDRLAIMFAVNWFGIDTSDPQGPGADPSYGNWRFEAAACSLANDPSTCTDFVGAGKQRSIASKRRPLAGIYSSSGRDDESKRRIDLMLSTIRRPCDDGARLDAFAIQLDSIQFTSAHPSHPQSDTWDIAYRALLGFYDRADAAGAKGAVAAAFDSTVYWHFGDAFGLTTQDQRKAALTDDLVDAIALADAHPSATRIDGKLLLLFYTDAALITDVEWQGILDDARTRSGKDFYTLDTELHASFFSAFDALAPWINLGHWASTSGATLYDHAVAWQEDQLSGLFAALPTYPGRVVFASVTPGFDDYTMDWGACTPREIPRDPQVIAGQMDVNTKHALKGIVAETWDDWTEGHEFEPDVVGGTEKIVQLRQTLGKMFGDPVDPAGDTRLDARWTSFGQARSCCFVDGSCADAGTPPPVDLTCPDAGVDGGAADAKPDAPHADASTSDAGSAAGESSSSGCGCRAASSHASFGALIAACVALFAFVRRRVR